MILSEALWAKVGKFLVVLGAAVSIALGVLQLVDRFSGPRLVAVVERSKYFMHPRTRENLKERVDAKVITEAIRSRQKAGKSPQETLDLVLESLNSKNAPEALFGSWPGESWIGSPWRGLSYGVAGDFYVVTVVNGSNEVAHDVRLIAPGSGWAEKVRGEWWDSDAEVFEWKDEVVIGMVHPGATVLLRVWPDRTLYRTLRPALVHSKGSGTAYVSHRLYGWTADLQYWFYSQSAWGQYLSVIAMVLLVVGLIAYAVRRRHLVFSLRGKRPEKKPAGDTQV